MHIFGRRMEVSLLFLFPILGVSHLQSSKFSCDVDTSLNIIVLAYYSGYTKQGQRKAH